MKQNFHLVTWSFFTIVTKIIDYFPKSKSNVYMCVYIYTCICNWICVFMCVHMHVCVFVHICIYVCISLGVCLYVCVCTHEYATVCVHVCMYTHMHLCMYVHTCVSWSVYVCTCAILNNLRFFSFFSLRSFWDTRKLFIFSWFSLPSVPYSPPSFPLPTSPWSC